MYIQIASKLISSVTIHTNIALAGEHIFQVLAQYLKSITTILTRIVTILASIEQVNTPLVHVNPTHHRCKEILCMLLPSLSSKLEIGS